MSSLAGRTIFITGGSRGIGRAIALRAARDGANVVIASKTTEPHPKLPGTIYTVAEEVEAAGGKAAPIAVDIRDEKQVISAVEQSVKKFGGIDILVNNASAIFLTNTLNTSMKAYDLMQNINTRGTFLVSKVCIPYLKESKNPHILTMSPFPKMTKEWFSGKVAYGIAKYGMSMCVLGMSHEFANDGIAVNALWPRTSIFTAATAMLVGPEVGRVSRTEEIVSDATYAIITKPSRSCTGNFFIDEDVLRAEGVTDFKKYAVDPSNEHNLLDLEDLPKVSSKLQK